MAYIQRVKNELGEVVKYKIKVSCGYDIYGKQITRTKTFIPKSTAPTKMEREAKEQAVLFEREVKKLREIRNVKFAEIASEWLGLAEDNGKLKTATIELYKGFRERVFKSIGHLYIDKIKRSDIQNLIFTLAKGTDGRKKLTEKSQKNYICFVSNVFNYAVRNEILIENPCRNLTFVSTPKKKRQFYSLEEEKQLLKRLEECNAIYAYRVCYMFLILLGLRIGECLGLEWKDIDFEKGTVFIQRNSQYKNKNTGIYTTTPKTKSSVRCLKLPQELIDMLIELKAQYEDNKTKCGDMWQDTDRVFNNGFGKPIHPNQPYNYLKRFCEREGLPFKGLHSFRHSMVTNLIHNGVDVATISNIAGHINGNVTLSVYAHEFREATAYGCEVMSNLLKNKSENSLK